jgi:hypothetical protein
MSLIDGHKMEDRIDMKKFALNSLTVFLAVVLITSCAKSSDNPKDPKQILEKTVEKYRELVKKDGKGVKSMEAKVSIKGGGQLPMGDSGSMPLDIDAIVEIYVSQPHNLYLDISGNLGNARFIVSGKEKPTATIMLPATKQFATMDVPDQIKKQIDEAQEPKEDPQEPDSMEDLWKQVILEYDGTENLKIGKAQKIIIKPKDPAEKSFLTAYILDGKWDPARLEITEEEGSNLLIEFEKLELNAKIPDGKFVPDTEGYTEVTQQTIFGSIMMQIMSSMMQKSTEE